jgi:PEP-CTERM motif
MRRSLSLLAITAPLVAAGQAQAAVNILPSAVSSTSLVGVQGVLRSATWLAGSTPSSTSAPYDGVIPAEGTQWNNTSFWWDQDARVNPSPVSLTFNLNGAYTISSMIAQADDNDSYLVEYWNGSSWAAAWNIPTQPSFGLVTRNSGALGPFTTSKLRFSATGGDNYYALSELQVFGVAVGVPEPSSWLLLVGGFGLIGAALRRKQNTTVRLRFG